MMDWGHYLIIVIVLFFVMKRFMPVKGVLNITTTDVKDKINDKDIQFIDVRTIGEYKAHYKKPFVNIPLSQLENRYHELDKNKEVVLICQSGMRSRQASRILKKHGFNHVSNVKGGLSAWI